MKKLTSALLVLVLVFAFTACSNSSTTDTSNTSSNISEDTSKSASESSKNNTSDISSNTSENVSKSTDESSDNKDKTATGKTLVVYYSSTGSTKAVAETIAKTASADLFEITPVEPYTSDDLDWTNDGSRVNIEHNDESKRDIQITKSTPDNWEQYDTVFVGYPIWWGIAAWPINGFISANDFTGKTVIPFCTSASSSIGESGQLLAQAAGTGNWLEGERFSSGVSSTDVESWVKGLDL